MTLYERNARGLCITDHHDVTEEDVHQASLGQDADLFGEDFFAASRAYRRREVFKGRDAEWMRRFHASKLRGPHHD